MKAINENTLSGQERAWLLRIRDDLLAPVSNLVSLAEMVQAEARDLERPKFLADMQRIYRSARQLFDLIEEFFDPAALATLSLETLAVLQSRVRHDMLNALNPVVNYSEMWLEDAEEAFLDAFLPDLRKIHTLGKQAVAALERLRQFNRAEVSSGPVFDLASLALPPTQTVEAGAPGNCLVVDDNPVNRDILQRMLEKLGHRVETAVDGKQALDMLQRGAFDLMLLDILMPELNGFQLLDRVKSDPVLREVPVIMISALDQDDSVIRCIALGAEDYLSRPFNPLLLRARIGASLEKKRLRDREKLHLAEIERQRRRSDELLHVILPNEIVEELKATDEVKPRRYDDVAVLFADLVNFTPYCDHHRPEEVVHHLQRLVEEWENIAVKHEVEKIKTIGDAFMAASGLLRPAANPVLQAVRCGLEMIAATRQRGPEWDLRVGIHIGQVVAGVIGRRQYLFDLWGDTVNVAARMESHGTPGAITLTTHAWDWIKAQAWGVRHHLDVKGKGSVPAVRFEGFLVPVDPPGDQHP